MLVDLLEIVNSQIALVVSVVFLEDSCDFLFGFVAIGLSVHCFHKLDETDTSSFLRVEFCSDFVSGFSVWFETVLSEQQLQVVGKKDSHTCGIIGVKNLLEVDYVLIAESTGDVEPGFEFSQIFASKTNSIDISAIYFGGAFVGTVAELLGGVSEVAAFFFIDEGAGSFFIPDLFHGHVQFNPI